MAHIDQDDAMTIAMREIRSAPVLHDTVCETADMQKTVETILGL